MGYYEAACHLATGAASPSSFSRCTQTVRIHPQKYIHIIYPKDYRWQQIHMLMWRELLDGHVNTKVVKVMQQILPLFLQSWGGPEDDVCCRWVCQTAIVFLRKNWNQRALLKIKDIWSIWPMCKYCSPWLESLVGRSLIDGGKALGNEPGFRQHSSPQCCQNGRANTNSPSSERIIMPG